MNRRTTTAERYLSQPVLYGGLAVTRGTMLADLRRCGVPPLIEASYLLRCPPVDAAPGECWTIANLETLEKELRP